ncbi:hypothetical protein [Rhizobium laguerreae]|uniref:hypothetical protein n=1 Tax=Rhizobium laguerreae TaxID=1076926 RepID=UPI0021B0DC8A|nr:hypothetical protein [Rhizobium laguerreae]
MASIPEPRSGLVVRYDYLWSREALAGRDQGKDRPTCLVAASDSLTNPRYVVLLPITHTPPSGETIGIEIPPKVKQAIGLDDEPSWVIVSEYNIDEWPNGGLSPVRAATEYSLMASFRLDFLQRSRRGFLISPKPGKVIPFAAKACRTLRIRSSRFRSLFLCMSLPQNRSTLCATCSRLSSFSHLFSKT